jgi:hypothetical protein
MPDYSTDEIALNGRRYAIVSESLLPSGVRSIQRNFRATNVSDPGRLRRVQWEVWGPIGYSRQSQSDNALRTDYVQNLETRWPRRLISSGKRHFLDLEAIDPPYPHGEAVYDGFNFDDEDYAFGSPAQIYNVQFFDEQGGSLFAHRGSISTQIYIPTWTPVAYENWEENIVQGAAYWYGYGRVGFGTTKPIQTRTGVTATSATYEDTYDATPTLVYGSQMVPGSDRLWIVNASSPYTNWVIYTLDDIKELSAPLQVGDPKVGATGIGPFGPFTFFGSQYGLYTFTDQGKPIPLSRALANHRSDQNGKQWADPGWGWNYAITDIGLRAVNGVTDNPTGIGEAMRQFTGHNGLPTAIWAERGELFVAYETTEGDTYIYRGVFAPGTGGTGLMQLYPMRYLAGKKVESIFSSNTTPETAVVWGEDTNMAYEYISRIGREDLTPDYEYDVDGGTWYGTELDIDPNLLKTLRLARLRTVNMGNGDSWTLGFSFDIESGNPYVDIGTVYDEGFNTVYPVVNTYPQAGLTGRTIKPRLVQVAGSAGSSTTPPEVNGQLEIEYDERPAVIEEAQILIDITGTGYTNNEVMDTLQQLVSQSYSGPFKVTLPDDIPPGGGGQQRWCMVADVRNRHDLKTKDGNGIDAVEVTLHFWDTGQSEPV